MWVFALILAVPLIEIGLFVTLGGALGLWLTLAIVFGSAMLGVFVLRRGAMGMRRPGSALLQMAGSGLTVMAAMFLILPGFLTSFLGLILLSPIVQRGVIALVGNRLAGRGFAFTTTAPAQEDVIDGAFSVVPEPQPSAPQDKALPPSKWTRD